MLAQILLSKEAVALYTLIVMGLEKKFQFIRPIVSYVEKHKGVFKTVEQEGENVLNSVVHSPEVIALKTKADKLDKEVTHSEIFKAATAVLHNLDVKLKELSPDALNSVALAISTVYNDMFGKSVTVIEVLKVLDEYKTLVSSVEDKAAVKGVQQLVTPLDKVVPTDNTQQTPAQPQATA